MSPRSNFWSVLSIVCAPTLTTEWSGAEITRIDASPSKTVDTSPALMSPQTVTSPPGST